jgi:hypothetical protein
VVDQNDVRVVQCVTVVVITRLALKGEGDSNYGDTRNGFYMKRLQRDSKKVVGMERGYMGGKSLPCLVS